jgi:hypothetical protein
MTTSYDDTDDYPLRVGFIPLDPASLHQGSVPYKPWDHGTIAVREVVPHSCEGCLYKQKRPVNPHDYRGTYLLDCRLDHPRPDSPDYAQGCSDNRCVFILDSDEAREAHALAYFNNSIIGDQRPEPDE